MSSPVQNSSSASARSPRRSRHSRVRLRLTTPDVRPKSSPVNFCSGSPSSMPLHFRPWLSRLRSTARMPALTRP
eukprot:9703624-Lingulodinium_polyedra.AAC.1